MYVLIRIEDSALLKKCLDWLVKLKVWYRTFNEPKYRVQVTAAERAESRGNSNLRLNPPNAWETCASMKQIWDLDNGRPYPMSEHVLRGKNKQKDPAPRGKGFVKIEGRDRQRVAGECANPTFLTYISCPSHCTMYEPTSIEARIYIAEQTRNEHMDRAAKLGREIEFLQKTKLTYEQAIASGLLYPFDYTNGFVMQLPPASDGEF